LDFLFVADFRLAEAFLVFFAFLRFAMGEAGKEVSGFHYMQERKLQKISCGAEEKMCSIMR
jgi:hypothetical protein